MELTARDIMSPNVIRVSQAMDLRDLAKLLLSKGITGAPVVDEDGNLTGVVSQTDLIYYNLTRDDELVLPSDFYQHARVEGRHLPTGFQIEDINTGTVADVMTPVVHAVTEGTTVTAVARLMTRRHIHRIIVRKGRRAVGIISALDVLGAMSKLVPAGTGAAKRAGVAKKKPVAKKKVSARKKASSAGRSRGSR